MVELTKEEKTLLADIVNDKYSVGAFSGMILNGVIAFRTKGTDKQEEDTLAMIDRLTKTALMTRLRLKELSK